MEGDWVVMCEALPSNWCGGLESHARKVASSTKVAEFEAPDLHPLQDHVVEHAPCDDRGRHGGALVGTRQPHHQEQRLEALSQT